MCTIFEESLGVVRTFPTFPLAVLTTQQNVFRYVCHLAEQDGIEDDVILISDDFMETCPVPECYVTAPPCGVVKKVPTIRKKKKKKIDVLKKPAAAKTQQVSFVIGVVLGLLAVCCCRLM